MASTSGRPWGSDGFGPAAAVACKDDPAPAIRRGADGLLGSGTKVACFGCLRGSQGSGVAAMNKVLWFVLAAVLPAVGVGVGTAASAAPLPVIQVQSPQPAVQKARWV